MMKQMSEFHEKAVKAEKKVFKQLLGLIFLERRF